MSEPEGQPESHEAPVPRRPGEHDQPELPDQPRVAMFMIRFADGRQFGPAPMEKLLTWARDGRVPKNAFLVNIATDVEKSVMDELGLAAILGAPPTRPGQQDGSTGGGDDSMATIIPYRNPPALVGYYISIFSLIPLLGLLLGPTAIVCGIIGLRKRKAEPQRKGTAHAWVAISLGVVGVLISAGCLSGMFLTNWGY